MKYLSCILINGAWPTEVVCVFSFYAPTMLRLKCHSGSVAYKQLDSKPPLEEQTSTLPAYIKLDSGHFECAYPPARKRD